MHAIYMCVLVYSICYEQGYDKNFVKWTEEQHKLITLHGGYIRRVATRMCNNKKCELKYGEPDMIAEDIFAYSSNVSRL